MPRPVTRCSYLFMPALLFSVLALNAANAMEDAWEAPQEAVRQSNPVKGDKASIRNGMKLFFQLCTPCHGENGQGDGPISIRLMTEPPDLTALAGKKPDGELAWKIATGRNPMPKWEGTLSSSEIWDIVNYIQQLRPEAE